MANKYGDIRYKWLAEKGYNVLSDKHQHEYIKSLWASTDEVQGIFCNSKAGTGKTTIATLAGAYEVEKGTYDKIIYIRNAVSVRDQGAIPGNPTEKDAPYMQPFIEALDNVKPGLYEDWTQADEKTKQQKAYAISSTYTRGITWKHAFIIIDEAQNMDLDEFQAIYTRCTSTCKIVTIGSTRQVDNRKLKKYAKLTPFEVFMEHFKNRKVAFHELKTNYRGWFSDHADNVKETVDRLLAN